MICKKDLEPVFDNWDTMQPYGGGEVKMIFSYGSLEFDDNMHNEYRFVICDQCAKELIKQNQ